MIHRIILLFSIVISCAVGYGQLSGTYTIGNNCADYLTIKEAVTDMDTSGVSAPVIFNIQQGSYNTIVTISPITGASSTNTITFKSENNDSTSVEIVGHDRITIDNYVSNVFFSHLTFRVSQSNTTGRAIRIRSNTSNIGINNCIFIGGSGMSASNFDALNTSLKLTKAYINIFETTNLSIQNNIFGSNGTAIYKAGLLDINNIDISNNIINGTLGYGVILSRANNLVFNRNKFSGNIDQSIRISFYSGNLQLNSNQFSSKVNENARIHANSSISDNSIHASNNFFSSYQNCLRLINIDHMELYNNSFNTENSSCLVIEHNSPSTASLDILNNIFSRIYINEPCLYLPNDLPLDLITSNNNAFSNDSMVVGLLPFQDNSYNLDHWVAYSNKDQSSIVVGHVFSDFRDLHTPNAILLDGGAVPLITVPTDIDEDVRHAVTPDIGADEFNMDYTTYLDLELLKIIAPNLSCNSSDTLFLTLTNNCLTQIDSFKVITSFEGTSKTTFDSYYTISPGDTITIPVPECLFRENTLYKNFYCSVTQPNGLLDNNQSNNNGKLSNIFRLGNFKILQEENNYSDCPDKILTVPELPFSTINWSTGESTWSISINSSGTYSATVTSSIGCQLTKSIIIN